MPVPVFTAGEILTASAMNQVGLYRVIGCTVTSAGGTAATASNGVITVGSANTSVTVVDAFSADFENYRIIINNVDASAADQVFNMTLNNSAGTTYAFLSSRRNYTTGAQGGNNSAGAAAWMIGLTAANDNMDYVIDLLSPNLAKRTGMTVNGTVDSNYIYGGGQDTNAAAQTGFTITPTGGATITGGTIRVYGYRN
jgi:hypothetical protein